MQLLGQWADGCTELFVVTGKRSRMVPGVPVSFQEQSVVIPAKEMSLILGTDSQLKALWIVPGMEMHLSDSRGIPSCLIEQSGDGRRITADPSEIMGHIGYLRILTQHKGCPSRLAYRRYGAALIEDHPFPYHSIQSGRLHKIQPVAGK
jgi:hypothetical protein